MTRTQVESRTAQASSQEPAPVPTLLEVAPIAPNVSNRSSLEGVVEPDSVAGISASFDAASHAPPAAPTAVPMDVTPSAHSHSNQAIDEDVLSLAGLSFTDPQPPPTEDLQTLVNQVASLNARLQAVADAHPLMQHFQTATVRSAPAPAPTWIGLAQAPAASATAQSAPPTAPLWNQPPPFVRAPLSMVSGVSPSLVRHVDDILGGLDPSWSQSSPGVPPAARSHPMDGVSSGSQQEALPHVDNAQKGLQMETTPIGHY